MKSDTDNRAVILGRYIADTGATVRQCAAVYNVSKSTVHSDVTKSLRALDIDLYEKVRLVLDINKNERHIRGGLATKEKYRQVKDIIYN